MIGSGSVRAATHASTTGGRRLERRRAWRPVRPLARKPRAQASTKVPSEIAHHPLGHAALPGARSLGPQERRHRRDEHLQALHVARIVGHRPPPRHPRLLTPHQPGKHPAASDQLERELARGRQERQRIAERDAPRRLGVADMAPIAAGRQSEQQLERGHRPQLDRRNHPRIEQPRAAGPPLLISPQQLRRVLRALLEGGQHQVQLTLLQRVGLGRDSQRLECPNQLPHRAGERMLARPRLRRSAPATPRSTRGQVRALSPYAKPRVPRPEGVQSNHKRILS